MTKGLVRRDWIAYLLIMGAVTVIIVAGFCEIEQRKRRAQLAVVGAVPQQPAGCFLLAYGMPTQDGVICGDYAHAWDGMTRTPRWTLELLTASSLTQVVKRDNEHFRVDPVVPWEFNTSGADYAAPFDVGHMASANNHRSSQDNLDATFLYSNACPQYVSFNRGKWRRLEDAVAGLVTPDNAVYVITAPVFQDKNDVVQVPLQGKHRIWVATHFAKAVLIVAGDGKLTLRAWLLPHQKDLTSPLDSYRIPVDTFEEETGLDVFAGLSDSVEAELEQKLALPLGN